MRPNDRHRRATYLGLWLVGLAGQAYAGPPASARDWVTSSARFELRASDGPRDSRDSERTLRMPVPTCRAGQEPLLLGILGTQEVIDDRGRPVRGPYPAWAVSVPTRQRVADDSLPTPLVGRSDGSGPIAVQLPAGQSVATEIDDRSGAPFLPVRVALLTGPSPLASFDLHLTLACGTAFGADQEELQQLPEEPRRKENAELSEREELPKKEERKVPRE